MTEIALLLYSQTSPFYLCLSERLKNDILCPLIWCSADRQQEGPLLPELKATPPTTCIFMPLRVSYFEMGQRLGTHASCHHRVTFASNPLRPTILMQQSSHIFPYSCDTVQNSFNGSQSLFSVIIQNIESTRNEGNLYLRNRFPPLSSCRKGWGWLPALCGQTATVNTVL